MPVVTHIDPSHDIVPQLTFGDDGDQTNPPKNRVVPLIWPRSLMASAPPPGTKSMIALKSTIVPVVPFCTSGVQRKACWSASMAFQAVPITWPKLLIPNAWLNPSGQKLPGWTSCPLVQTTAPGVALSVEPAASPLSLSAPNRISAPSGVLLGSCPTVPEVPFGTSGLQMNATSSAPIVAW